MDHETLKQIIFDQHEVIKKSQIVSRDYVFDKNANYVLIGLRRSGKSTLLYKRVQDLVSSGVDWKQIIYINFDDERLLGFQASDFEDILLTAEEITSQKHYFYFDEIQNIDGWEKFAIRMANAKEKVDITGSNAKMLSHEVSAKLGGRYLTKIIHPYSFKEFLRAKSLEASSAFPFLTVLKSQMPFVNFIDLEDFPSHSLPLTNVNTSPTFMKNFVGRHYHP